MNKPPPPQPLQPMLVLRMTSRQRDQLVKFLNRSQMSGAEVPAFCQVLNLLQSAAPEPPADAPDQSSI